LSDKDKPSRTTSGAPLVGFIQPQLGFNNNVRYRGVVFHIQTEDSGVQRPHVTTHLFADGGRVIKSQRTDYSPLLKLADFAAQLKQLMKDQHRAMFTALRGGALDELLVGLPLLNRVSLSPAEDSEPQNGLSISPSLSAALPLSASGPPPVARKARRNLEPAGLDSVPQGAESSRVPAGAHSVASSADPSERSGIMTSNAAVSSSPPSSESGSQPSSRGRAPRPSAVFEFAPDSGRLFGSGPTRDASIDEAILNYISGESRHGG
jgi:hypothetical protein